jgi:hypothetical protein
MIDYIPMRAQEYAQWVKGTEGPKRLDGETNGDFSEK